MNTKTGEKIKKSAPLNLVDVIRLLLDKDNWKKSNDSIFDDKLIRKDGSVYFYCNIGTNYYYDNSDDSTHVAYLSEPFSWFFILRPLAKYLKKYINEKNGAGQSWKSQ